jgi:hypothetical protein
VELQAAAPLLFFLMLSPLSPMSLLVGGTSAVPIRRLSGWNHHSVPSPTNLSHMGASLIVLGRTGGVFSRTCLPDNGGRSGSVTTTEEEEASEQDNEESEVLFSLSPSLSLSL